MDTPDPIVSSDQEPKVQQIKVLNLKKNDIDLLTLSSDMLDIYFEDDTDGIKQLILEYQFLNNNNPTIRESDIEEIIIRRLLLDTTLIPIIDLLPGNINVRNANKSKFKDGISVQVKKRTMCIYYNNGKYYKIYVSNEEIIHLIGFTVNQANQYKSILDLYYAKFPTLSNAHGISNKNMDIIKSHVIVGNYTSDVMSVIFARSGIIKSPILLPDDLPNLEIADVGLIKFGYSDVIVGKLVSQIRNLMKIHSELNAYYVFSINKNLYDEDHSPIVQKEIADYKTFKFKLSNSLKELEKKLELPISELSTYKLNILSELYLNNTLPLYYYQLHKLTDEIDSAINFIRVKRIERLKYIENENAYFKNTAKAQRYLIIIQQKFGNIANDISHKLEKNNQLDEPNSVLKLLPDAAARKLVESEYLKMELKWKGTINNKCEHVKLVYKLMHINNIHNRYEILNQLRSTYYKSQVDPDPNNNHDMISCKVCGYNIICPHTDNMIEMQYNKRSYGVILEFLQKYSVKVGVDENDLDGFSSYYCKICNEFISKLYETKERDDTFRIYENSPVQKIMWFESLKAINNVVFSKLVDVKTVAKTIIDYCYPIYKKIETNIIKSTKFRYDENNIPPEVNMYIIIIIYAYILNMIRLSYGSTNTDIEKLGFRDVPRNSKMSKYAESIISFMLSTYEKIIQYSDLDNDIIIQRFKEMYKEMMVSGESSMASQNNINISIDDVISVNPIYRYASVMAKINTSVRDTEFKTVVGISMQEALENTYNRNKNALTQQLLGINRNNQKTFIQYPNNVDILYLYGIKNINFWRNMYKQPPPNKDDLNNENILKSFTTNLNIPKTQDILDFSRAITEFVGGIEKDTIRSKGRKDTKWNNVMLAGKAVKRKSYDLMREYLTEVDSQEEMDKYNKKFYVFKKEENSFLVMRSIANSKPYKNIKYTKSRSFDYLINKNHDMKLSYTYDENGIKHSWANNFKKNIYIYEDGSEYTSVDINTLLKTDTTNRKSAIIDIKCPHCNIKLSEINTINIQKIKESLIKQHKINNFFIFFTSRCPLGGVHTFKNVANTSHQECDKCKITTELIYTYNQSNQINTKIMGNAYVFYDKFKAEYDKLQNQSSLHTTDRGPITDARGSIKSKQDGFNGTEWKFSYNKLTELSILMNIDIKMLETLGYTEGADMVVVMNTEKYFDEITSNNSPVIQNLKAIILLVITSFNQFRYTNKYENILTKFKDNENFGNYKEYYIKNDRINNILNQFNANLNVIINTRKPKDVVLFQIETFCDILLQIAKVDDIKNEWVKKLSYDISKHILSTVLASEKMMTKFKNFNLKAYVDDDIIITI